jgi:hypothetical protein
MRKEHNKVLKRGNALANNLYILSKKLFSMNLSAVKHAKGVNLFEYISIKLSVFTICFIIALCGKVLDATYLLS